MRYLSAILALYVLGFALAFGQGGVGGKGGFGGKGGIGGGTTTSVGTWTLVQHKVHGGGAGSNQCTVSALSAIGTGHFLAAGGQIVDGTDGFPNLTITAVSDSHSTFTHCSNCSVQEISVASVAFGIDGSYTTATVSSGTSVTITFGNATSAHVGDINCWVSEYAWSGSTITFDTSGNHDDSTNCTSACAGVTLTITGTSDACVQGIADDTNNNGFSGTPAPGAPYTNPNFDSGDGEAWMGAINTVSGTAPTVGTQTSDKAVAMAMCAKGS